MARIWIVEDDPRIGLLIQTAMSKAGHQPRRLEDAEEMERALEEETPDLMLLDLMLRRKDGFVVLREWKERKSTRNIPVIILSARSSEPDKVRGLEMGAEDYMTKPFGVRELQARVNTALRRTVFQNAPVSAGPLVLNPDSRTVLMGGERVQLTYREFELLLYLVRRPGQTVSREQLLREVWGSQYEQDPTRTVDYHIKMLRMKLGDPAAQPRILQTVRGVGYRCVAGEQP